MNKLALSDATLLSVEKAARYIGNEINAVVKDPADVDIRFVMCFPDVYEIGMSHLGIQILYDMFNRRSDIWCERVFSPWMDLHKIMKEENIPLFALESQDPIRDFDFIGITLQYEMCYTNILQILDLGGIPLLASQRTDDDPIVIGGGPCTYNPEPLCDFFDIFFIGEGESQYDRFFDLYLSMKKDGSYTREAFLRAATSIPCLYVPSLYETSYNEDGTIAAFSPKSADIPATVKRQVITDLNVVPYPTKPVLPFVQATQDRMVLEIMRGCIRGCRFCQAGMVYRPNREKSVEVLKAYADELIKNTGHHEISLSSLSSSDYSELSELIDYLIEECDKRHINISLPSLRIDAFSLDVMKKVQDIKKSSITFAPEAGSQKMRNIINKGLTEEDIFGGAELAFVGGWNKVKLYFMLGLPLEEDTDVTAIPDLANEIAALYYDTVPKEKRQGRCNINISTSFFVPKPFTPLQWARMYPQEEYLRKAHLLKDTMQHELNHKSLSYQYHQADATIMEGIFARGDRRLGKVILCAYEAGACFDAWSEFFDMDLWMRAFEKCGIDPDFYTMRERDEDEIFPWDFIDIGVTKQFLLKEWKEAKTGRVTPNCRQQCSGCGSARFKTGVCIR